MEKVSKRLPGMELSLLAESHKILHDVISSAIPVGEAIAAFVRGEREEKIAKEITAVVKAMTDYGDRIDRSGKFHLFEHRPLVETILHLNHMLERQTWNEFASLPAGDDWLIRSCTENDPATATLFLAKLVNSCDTGLDGKLVQRLLALLDRKEWKPMVDEDANWHKSRIWGKFTNIYSYLESHQRQNPSNFSAERKIDEFVQRTKSLGITHETREELLYGMELHFDLFRDGGWSDCILKSKYIYNEFKTENVFSMAFGTLEHLNLLGFYTTVCSHVLNSYNTSVARSAVDDFLKDAEPIIKMLTTYPSVLLSSSWPEAETELLKQRVHAMNEGMREKEGKFLPDNSTCEKYSKALLMEASTRGHPDYKKQTVMFFGKSAMDTNIEKYFHFNCRKDVCIFIPGEHMNVLVIRQPPVRSAGIGTSDQLTEYTNNVSSIILNAMPKYRSVKNVVTAVTELAMQQNLWLVNLVDHQGFAILRYEQFHHPCPFPAFSLEGMNTNGTEASNQVLYYWDAKKTLKWCQNWLFLFF